MYNSLVCHVYLTFKVCFGHHLECWRIPLTLRVVGFLYVILGLAFEAFEIGLACALCARIAGSCFVWMRLLLHLLALQRCLFVHFQMQLCIAGCKNDESSCV